jgi:K+-transporting ATPase ATPase C chain
VTEQAITSNIQAYIALDKAPNGTPYYPGGLTAGKVPVDAADTSASGIDPDISVRNADIQAYRIAAVRNLSLGTVDKLISTYTSGRGLGFSGEPGVDVLELNLALDRRTGGS